MGDVVWVQCQNCGKLHKIKQKDISIFDDDLYIQLHCPQCRDDTKHLWCGEDETEVYIYYNANLDPRYY